MNLVSLCRGAKRRWPCADCPISLTRLEKMHFDCRYTILREGQAYFTLQIDVDGKKYHFKIFFFKLKKWEMIERWLRDDWEMTGRWLGDDWEMTGRWLGDDWELTGRWPGNDWEMTEDIEKLYWFPNFKKREVAFYVSAFINIKGSQDALARV